VISKRLAVFSTFVTALSGAVDGTALLPNQQRSAVAIELPRSDAPVGVVTHSLDRQSAAWRTWHLAAIWYPVGGEPLAARSTLPDAPPSGRGPFPILVYSHGGCGGSPQAMAPIATSIARAGFVFVQIPHPGAPL